MIKRVLLTIAPQEFGRSYNAASFWSIGPLRLASMLLHPKEHRLWSVMNLENRFDFDVSLIDGDITGLEAVLKKINSDIDIVGIHNPSSYSYKNALKIAQTAKEKGIKTVVIGGHHVNFLSDYVLKNNPEIDIVSTGRGEISFFKLCNNYPLENIENIAYRTKDKKIIHTVQHDPSSEKRKSTKKFTRNKITHNPWISEHSDPLHIDNLPRLDYSILQNIDAYYRNFQTNYASIYKDRGKEPKRAAIDFTHEGCLWREVSGGCTFCALPTEAMTYRQPKIFWKGIEYTTESLGIDLIKDYGDCLTGNQEYLRTLAEAKPSTLENISFEGYVKANEIVSGDTLQLLKKIGIIGALIGLESGSSKVLQKMHKGTTRHINHKAIDMMINSDIAPFCSVILGSRGETLNSLQDTYEMIAELGTKYNLAMVGANPTSVFPGSPDWNELVYNNSAILIKHGIELDKLDTAPMSAIRDAYYETFCPELIQNFGDATQTTKYLIDMSKNLQKFGKLQNHLGWE